MEKKRTTISFHDPYVLEGAKRRARGKDVTLSEYVEDLIAADLRKHLGYKITSRYENGECSEEIDFYTEEDFMESVLAYREIFKRNEPLPSNNSVMVEYQAWKKDQIVESQKR